MRVGKQLLRALSSIVILDSRPLFFLPPPEPRAILFFFPSIFLVKMLRILPNSKLFHKLDLIVITNLMELFQGFLRTKLYLT